MAELAYDVVLYKLDIPQDAIIVSRNTTLTMARGLCKNFCGSAWTMNRRPDVHTCGQIVLAVRLHGGSHHG